MNVLTVLTFLGVIATVFVTVAIYRKVSQPADTTEAARRIEAVTARLNTLTGKVETETTAAAGIEPAAPTERT